MRAFEAAGGDAASDAAHLLHKPMGRPPFLQLATIVAAIPVAAASDRSQSSLKLENFPQHCQGLKQGEMNLAGGNELAVADAPSSTTQWRLRKAMLPETAHAHVPTPTRIRALKEPANAQSIAAAMATLSCINAHNMFNMDTTTVTIGDLMSDKPIILLAAGSKKALGRMNLAPAAPRASGTSLEYFSIPLNVTHSADGGQYHVAAVIKHAVIADIMVFRISDRVSLFFTPINFDRTTYFFHYFNEVVIPMVRVARQDLLRVLQSESNAVALTLFSAANMAVEVEAACDDDVLLLSGNVSTAAYTSSSSSVDSAAAHDDSAMLLPSDLGSASQSSRDSSSSSASTASVSSARTIWSGFFSDGDGPQMNMLLTRAVQDICNHENLAVVKFPAASSARSQPHDRKSIAVELHRHFANMAKDREGVPSLEMRQFMTTQLTKLGLPPSSIASLRRFLSHCEAIFAIAVSPKRCQESWGDQGTGYRNQNGEMNLKSVFAQYVHWKEMDSADAQRMIEYEFALIIHCASAPFSSATLCFMSGLMSMLFCFRTLAALTLCS